MRTEILRVEFLNKTFSQEKVLNNVSFNVFKGETLALLGANGAGKTSLINIISGITTMDSGRLFFYGKPININSPHDAKALGIYTVQDRNRVIDTLSVAENIFLGSEDSYFVNKRKLHQHAKEFMKQVGLEMSPDTPAYALSLSEKALVQLASVLLTNPTLLIIDESSLFSSDIDPPKLFRVLGQLKIRDTAVIYITHNIREAMEISDRIFILRNGISVGIYEKGAYTMNQIVTSISGHALVNTQQPRNPSEQTILRVEHLSGNILSDVSFSVYKGEIFGVTGLLDAGKTELLNILSGMKTKYRGSLFFEENEVSFSDPYDALQHGIVYVPEDKQSYGFIPSMTVRENVTLSSLRRISTFGWIHKKNERYFTNRYLKLLDAESFDQNSYMKELSNGQQQKVQIAKCLANRPKIMLMDEPDKSMDIASKEEILRTIRKLSSEGLTLVIASMDIDRLLHICDRLLILHNGTVKGELSGDDMPVQ